MSKLNPIHSLTGFAHQKLDSITKVEDSEGTLNKCKIAGGFLGNGAFLIASAVETAVRYVIAYGSWAILIGKSKEKKESLKKNYTTPFFNHAKTNADVFIKIKNTLTANYNDYVAPFLKDKVQKPT
jgi:hypothetical protein